MDRILLLPGFATNLVRVQIIYYQCFRVIKSSIGFYYKHCYSDVEFC